METKTDHSLGQGLDSWDKEERRRAVEIASRGPLPPREASKINLHCHSFFSFNAHGWSPSRVAMELSRGGAWAGGLVDFDVLDGMEEFRDAGMALGIRTNASLETRTFNQAFADKAIDSPGEPGVSYVCASGFVRAPEVETLRGEFLAYLRRNAAERNRALVGRINRALPELAIDYENEVVPLSPGGCPTERHVMRAYAKRLALAYPDAQLREQHLAGLLGMECDRVRHLATNEAQLADALRSRLAKAGGVGYEQPGPRTFPRLDDFFSWARACGAIPMESWLDGTSEGEADPRVLFEASRAMGAVALNIIPDRNWNVKDPVKQNRLVANLHEVLETAKAMKWPVMIGTELNKTDQPLFDDLGAKALIPWMNYFQRSAALLVGHSIAARHARLAFGDPNGAGGNGYAFLDDWEFFVRLGMLEPLTKRMDEQLAEMTPDQAEAYLHDCVRFGRWNP